MSNKEYKRYYGSIVLLLFFSGFLLQPLLLHTASDTTIYAWKQERMDHPRRVAISHMELPEASKKYQRVIMTYTLECPRGGCDPWDRVANVWVIDPSVERRSDTSYHYYYFNAQRYEIARLVTPYGKGWSWEFDVTDYRAYLTDTATLMTYISTFTGEGTGYLMTVSLRFEEGEPDFIPYRIVKLWDGYFDYGDPAIPIEKKLVPVKVEEKEASFAKVRVRATGHGQGNTDNAGEFARKQHSIVLCGRTFSHYLWRDDCANTPAGPQYGTYDESRAGFLSRRRCLSLGMLMSVESIALQFPSPSIIMLNPM